MYKLLYLLVGYIQIKISGENAINAINILKSENLKFYDFNAADNGYLISTTVFNADAVLSRLDALGVEWEIVKKRGISFVAFRYKARIGLLAGALLAMIIVYGSTRILWDVRLDCNGEFDEKQAYSALAKLGVECGKPIGSIDIYNAELMFLVQNPNYSDIAINIQGTVAAVKLRLRIESPRQEEKHGAYDVIAAEAGVIYSIYATRGVPVVKKGDTVAAGDMLISGTVQGAYGEYYLHHAYGSVKAIVYRDFYIAVPITTKTKNYTGNIKTKTTYSILGKRLSLFWTELSPYEKSNVEIKTKSLSLFGIKFPIKKEVVTYTEYNSIDKVLSENEAKRQAELAFDAYLEREIEGEVLTKSSECIYNEELNAVVLNGTAEIITEIGVETEMKELPQL